MWRSKANGRSVGVILGILGGGLVGVWLAMASSGDFCYRALEGRERRLIVYIQKRCVSLVYPYVVDSSPLESSARPRLGSSGLGAMDEAIAAIATDFEFGPGTTASDRAEVTMEYVVGLNTDTRGRLVRWLSAIGD